MADSNPRLGGAVPVVARDGWSVRMEQVRSESHGPVTVVCVGPDDGSLRFDVLQELRRCLIQLAAEIEPPNLLIDLGATKFFGGGFMGTLCRCHHAITERGGQFALCNVRPYLLGEVKAARLHSVWKIYPTRQHAIDAMEETDLCSVPR
jgi:anti-anti-sigma factor